jgi:hypothetical protein
MGSAVYSPPQVRDYGSLVALTADFDATFVGSVAKVVTMAAVSGIVPNSGGEGGGGGNTVVPENSNPQAQTPSGGGPSATPGPGSGSGGEVLSGTPGDTAAGGGGGTPSGGTAAGGGGTVSTAGAGDDGGKLPLTGFALATVAWAGAVMTGAGIAVKAKLRRRA